MSLHPHPNQRKRRGNVVTLGLSLISLIGAAALVVDVGYPFASQTQVQAAIDAAALAGVGYYDRTAQGVALARAKAIEFAALNDVMGSPVQLPADAISTGFINADGDFVPSDVPAQINAMQIDHKQVDIPVFFASIAFDTTSLSAWSQSIAVRNAGDGAGRVPCTLPIAIPDCILDMDKEEAEDLTLRMASSNEDNAGWASLSGNVSANTTKSALEGDCEGNDAQVGEPVWLQNGQVTSALQTIAKLLNGDLRGDETAPWDSDRWGPLPGQMNGSAVNGNRYGNHILEGPIILFDAGNGGQCLSSLQFNQTKTITGFGWAMIYDVSDKGKDKTIQMKLDLTNEYVVGTTGGGLPTNVVSGGSATLVY